jgi:small-conductance mechanosensitive channel
MEEFIEDNIQLSSWWDQFVLLLKEPIFSIGGTDITVIFIFIYILSILFLIFFASQVKRILTKRIFPRYSIEPGFADSIGTIVRYIVLIIGFYIIFQQAGLNLSSLGILAGALGVGIGFGLQNITNNFISGLIILFERPIKVGDRIEVGDIVGDVQEINARSTTVITNDNISVIIPNSEFINSTVINWSHNERLVRFRFPVGVSYNEDPEKVKSLLLEVVDLNEGVLKTPAPDVLFENFGDSSLDFQLLVWTSEYTNRPAALKSQLYFEIFKKFKKHGIEIPFPQNDIHLRSGWEKLKSSIVEDQN